MSRIRIGVVVLVVVAALHPPAAQAEPNPYGRRSSETTIVVQRDGSYDVTLVEAQSLVREYQIRFGGAVHDGFRLPDDGSVIPPYLRAAYTLTSAELAADQPAPAAVQTGHRWSLTSVGTYPAGDHQAELSYRVTGAARPTDAGWEVRARLLDIAYQPGDPVTIVADAAQPAGLALGCVSYAPDSEPCGERRGSTLTYAIPATRTEVPPEFVITVESRVGQVADPPIDRG